eukprot:7191448-Prymnesium_polylepis.1
MARLAEKETAPPDAKASIELHVEAARQLARREEQKMEAAVNDATEKWDALIERRVAVEEKCAAKEREAKAKIETAKKRASDLQDQATKRVQEETLANASKRARTAA